MQDIVAELFAGNRDHAGRFDREFEALQESQEPSVVTVCCGDSRVLQDDMWNNHEPGRIFSIGNIGNRVVQRTDEGPRVAGDVLYPLCHTGTKTAIVVGHTGCGAVTAAYSDLTEGIDEPPSIDFCVQLLESGIGEGLESGLERLPQGLDKEAAINHLIEYNVDRQVEFLADSPEVSDDVGVLGVVYDFQDVYDGPRGKNYLINVDGERDVGQLRESYPDLEAHVQRLWEY